MSAMPPRKVLLASHHASRMGSAVSLMELGTRLSGHGYAPVFLFSKQGELVDQLKAGGFRVVEIKRQGLFRLGMIRSVQQLIRSEGIDLVHVNSAVPFSKYVAIAARLLGIPVVWHIREAVEDKRMARQRPWIKLLASRIVVLTSPQAAFFNAPDKTRRIFNGVDIGRFARPPEGDMKAALGYAEDEFVFVLVGSIENRKGQLRAAQALARILPDCPRCRLLIVGRVAEQDEMAALDALLAGNAALQAAVRVHGSSDDVRPLLWGSDCLLLPSLGEAFPRTIMEGMAAGLPIIATPVGAVEDMMVSDVHGLIVPPGEVPALADAMRSMAADGGRAARRMAAGNPAAAERSFDMKSHLAAVAGLYDELLAGRHSPR
ncbi:MAG: glycosyltransferase family 4 protein [Rhodocyclales bacterium]|nr:glycosyltransferase family 4 protein [Rhodocyclales bacterium]